MTMAKINILNTLYFIIGIISLCCIPVSFAQRSNSDCYIVKGTTLKLEDTHVDKYLSVTSVEECKKECDRTFLNCKSFSYRDSSDDIADANCLLSRENSQTLNTRDSRDFNYNEKYTFYERSNSIDCDRTADTDRKDNFNRDPFPNRNEKFPIRNEIFPSRNENYPGRNEISPNRNEIYPGRNENYPGRNEIFPNRDEIYPGRNENYPGRNEIFPNRDEIFPGRKENYPTRKGNFPDRNENYPDRRENYPNNNEEYPDRNPDRRPSPPMQYPVRKDSTDSINECFKRVASGKRVVNRLVEAKLVTVTRSECEEECLRATFICRGFNYRYAIVSSPQSIENCELSTQDSYASDLEDAFIFARDPDFDYYERTGFGKNCDGSGPYRTGETRPNSLGLVKRYEADDRRFQSDMYNEQRYNDRYGDKSRYGPSNTYKTAVRYTPVQTFHPKDFYYPTTTAGNYDSYRYGYGSKYRYPNYNYHDNYGHNRDCFRFYQKETRLDSRAIRNRLQVRDLNECKEECRTSRNFACRTISYSYAEYSSSWFGKDNCYLSELSISMLDQYDLIYDRSFDIYVLEEYNGRDCNSGGGGGPGFFPHDDHYDDYGREDLFETVSGLPCLRGGCRLDRLGKYYYCETDPTGGWDYCCRPNEYCDYSAGYPLKWCYVGVLGNDQWRPCNMRSVGGLRSYLKEGTPATSMLLEDPMKSNSTSRKAKDLEMDHPIELDEITDLAGAANHKIN